MKTGMRAGVEGAEHFRTIISIPCLPSKRHPSVKRVTNPWWLQHTAARLCWMHIIYRGITAPPCIRLCAAAPLGEASCVLLDYHETRARTREGKKEKTSRKSREGRVSISKGFDTAQKTQTRGFHYLPWERAPILRTHHIFFFVALIASRTTQMFRKTRHSKNAIRDGSPPMTMRRLFHLQT